MFKIGDIVEKHYVAISLKRYYLIIDYTKVRNYYKVIDLEESDVTDILLDPLSIEYIVKVV